MSYCLTHNQEVEELYPEFWECESCFAEYYGQDRGEEVAHASCCQD